MNPKLIIAIAAAILLTACASGKSGDVYTRDQVRQVQTYRVGTIETIRPVRIEGTKTPIGSTAGAVVGGVAGSTVGSGKGSAVVAVLGAVAGGVAGAAVEEGLTRQDGLEFDIRLENGSHISVVQAAQSVDQETFAVGDRVRVVEGAGVVRITH